MSGADLAERILKGSAEERAQLVASAEPTLLLEELDRRSGQHLGVRDYVSALLQASSAQESFQLRVVSRVVQLLLSGALSGRESHECCGVLSAHLATFGRRAAGEVALLLVRSLEEGGAQASDECAHDGSVYELLPRALTRIPLDGTLQWDNETYTGAAFRKSVVGRICEARWPAECAVNLASMFRELPLTAGDQKAVLQKTVAQLDAVSLDALPALVYQVLLLASSARRGDIILRVAEYFVEREEALAQVHGAGADAGATRELSDDEKLLMQTEGTVLLHIDFALKHDSSLGAEFLKAVGKRAVALTPFMFAVLLIVSRAHRHKEKATKLLLSLVTTRLRDHSHEASARWASSALKKKHPNVALERVVGALVRNSQFGWQPVIQPLLALASSFLARRSARRDGLGQRLCALGISILGQVFHVHHVSRSEIVSLCLSSINCNSSSTSEHWVALLHELVRKYAPELVQWETKIKGLFDYLSFLPQSSGLALISAVVPLCAISKGLESHLMIVLRKAMFHGDVQSRVTAVVGFIRWLLAIDAGREALQHQLFNFLQRALTQQAEIRRLVYEGLVVLLEKHPRLSERVFVALQHQLGRYFVSDSDVPLKLKRCADDTVLLEPLSHLIGCAMQCLKLWEAQQSESGETRVGGRREAREVQRMLSALASAVRRVDLEDYELDKAADFSDSVVGKRNAVLGELLSATYTAAIEVVVASQAEEEELDEETSKEVVRLFECRERLAQVMTGVAPASEEEGEEEEEDEGGNKKKKKRKRKTKRRAKPRSLARNGMRQMLARDFSFPVLLKLINVMFRRQQDSVSEILRENKTLQAFIVHQLRHVMVNVIDNAETRSRSMDPRVVQKQQAFCRAIASALFVEYKRGQEDLNVALSETVTHMLLFLDATLEDERQFASVLASANGEVPEASSMVAPTSDSSTAAIFADQVERFHGFLMPLITGGNYKELTVLTRCFRVLYDKIELSVAQGSLQSVLELLQHRIEHSSAAKACMEMLMCLAARAEQVLPVVKTIASDLQVFIGRVFGEEEEMDEEEEDENGRGHNKYGIINERTWGQVAGVLLGQVESQLAEVEWAISIFKGNYRTAEFKVEKLRALCFQKQRELIECLCIMQRTNFEWGSTGEHMLKTVTKFLRQMVGMVKVWTAQKYMPEESFRQLLPPVSALIGAVYNYLDSVHSNEQMEDPEEGRGKKVSAVQQKARVRRETQLKPALVYEIERLETSIIKFQEQCKVPLMTRWRRSTVRDFKLSVHMLKTLTEQAAQSERQQQQEAASAAVVVDAHETNNDDAGVSEAARAASASPSKRRKKGSTTRPRKRKEANDAGGSGSSGKSPSKNQTRPRQQRKKKKSLGTRKKKRVTIVKD